MASLLDKHLVFVTGKGGVGRSTVATALGLAAAAGGRKTLLVEVAEQERVSRIFERAGVGPTETELTDGLWAVSIDMQEALREWLKRQLGSPGPLAHPARERRLPALRRGGAGRARDDHDREDLGARPARALGPLRLGLRLPRGGRARLGARARDAPRPRAFADIARVGPIRRQADKVWSLVTDTERTGYLAVALPEEMPVNETVELEDKLADQLGVPLDAIVMNGLYPRRFKKGEAAALEAAAAANGAPPGERAALLSALSEDRRARGQQSQLRRLRRGRRACRDAALPVSAPSRPGGARAAGRGAQPAALSHRCGRWQPHAAAASSPSPSSIVRTGT